MTSRIVVSLFLFAVLTPFAISQPTFGRPFANCILTAEDYAVYGAALSNLRSSGFEEMAWQDRLILVVDVTVKVHGSSFRSKFRAEPRIRSNVRGEPSHETTANFDDNASSICQLTESFGTPQSHRLITRTELEALFKRDEFNKKYPRAAGYWEFSRPGYNTTHNEAIVYLANHCGGLCGTGNLVFLRKENGQWKVVRGRMLWIS